MTELDAPHPTQPPPAKENAPGATASMVCGIVGTVAVGIVLGIVAIALAAKARRHISAEPQRYGGKGMATAGLVLGIIDVCVWGLALIPWIVIVLLGVAGLGIHN